MTIVRQERFRARTCRSVRVAAASCRAAAAQRLLEKRTGGLLYFTCRLQCHRRSAACLDVMAMKLPLE